MIGRSKLRKTVIKRAAGWCKAVPLGVEGRPGGAGVNSLTPDGTSPLQLEKRLNRTDKPPLCF
jgi:hypothetical protein